MDDVDSHKIEEDFMKLKPARWAAQAFEEAVLDQIEIHHPELKDGSDWNEDPKNFWIQKRYAAILSDILFQEFEKLDGKGYIVQGRQSRDPDVPEIPRDDLPVQGGSQASGNGVSEICCPTGRPQTGLSRLEQE